MPHFFTSAYKRRLRVVGAALTMLAGTVPFAAGLLCLTTLREQSRGLAPAALTLVAFILGGLLPWLAQDRLALVGNAKLRRLLADRLRGREGDAVDLRLFVGFAPADRLHVWEGETDRDVGFLALEANRLTFRGDEYSWSLPRDCVDQVDLTSLEGGVRRVVIRWHAARETGRAISLISRDATSLRQCQKATQALYERLLHWWQGEDTGEVAEAHFGLPPTDLSGATMLEEPAAGSCLTTAALGAIVIITVWRIATAFLAANLYYHALLWSGLVSVLGALVTGHVLHYLQAWETANRPRRRD